MKQGVLGFQYEEEKEFDGHDGAVRSTGVLGAGPDSGVVTSAGLFCDFACTHGRGSSSPSEPRPAKMSTPLDRRQLRNLPLQLRDQPHQLVALRGREGSLWPHT